MNYELREKGLQQISVSHLYIGVDRFEKYRNLFG